MFLGRAIFWDVCFTGGIRCLHGWVMRSNRLAERNYMRAKGRPKGSRAELKEDRLKAMRLLDECKSLSKVAQQLKVSVSSVHRWKEAKAQSGEKGLDGKRHPGPTPRLTASQKEDLKDMVMKLAVTCGCKGYGPFCCRVAEIIEQRYSVIYSGSYISALVRSFGLTSEELYRRGGGTGNWRSRQKPCTRGLFF